ncbi:XTP/dITP diphosphatase [Sporolactobacillus vineae]|uniref:XTP/dITP diphosphatase n=1 Tax=Sporolactobacillus vineae TaxID=444463 RepID=UPI00028A299B|nr:XTP/dITP diphosphatase [Sporolactobacillus vineae]
MTQVLIASNNQGKIKEIKELLEDFDVNIRSLKDLNIVIDVPETGKTFKENAALKAEALSKETHLITIADDSGLSVDALHGEPGIYSARYSGPEKDSERNIDKLLGNLKGVPTDRRTAHFSCTLALSIPGTPTRFAVGRCDGVITTERRGADGFGYDPVFLVPDEKETFAEMGEAKKNRISHRARALQELRRKWPEWVGKRK